jgi:hypothetical protein
MSPLSWRDRIPLVNSALLGALFVLIPTQIAPVYVLSMLMLGLWIVDGHLRDKWHALRGNPVFWVFQAFFWWVVIALAWTDDMAAGRGMVTRHLFFMLAAVYFTVARREHAHRYLLAFAISVLVCEPPTTGCRSTTTRSGLPGCGRKRIRSRPPRSSTASCSAPSWRSPATSVPAGRSPAGVHDAWPGR